VESASRLQAELEAEMAKLHSQVNASKSTVVADLLRSVTSV